MANEEEGYDTEKEDLEALVAAKELNHVCDF